MTRQEKRQKVKTLRKRMNSLGMELLKVDPWVPITLGDDKEYRLEYSYGAAIEVFKETGKNINLLEISSLDLGNPEVFPVLLFAGLHTHHEGEFTDVNDLLQVVRMRHLVYYITCIATALDAAQPDRDEVDDLAQQLKEVMEEEPELPLAQMNTFSDSGPSVEISDAPNLT